MELALLAGILPAFLVAPVARPRTCCGRRGRRLSDARHRPAGHRHARALADRGERDRRDRRLPQPRRHARARRAGDRAAIGRPGAARPPALRMPDRRRVRQPQVRLRPATRRRARRDGGGGDRGRLGRAALPAPGRARHRPGQQAARLSNCRIRASTRSTPTIASACPPKRATSRLPRACSRCSACTPSG